MDYECIGVCTPDPVSGLCQGCGRPLQDPATPATAPGPDSSQQPAPPALPAES